MLLREEKKTLSSGTSKDNECVLFNVDKGVFLTMMEICKAITYAREKPKHARLMKTKTRASFARLIALKKKALV